jgi:hypothetical protein
MANKCSSDRHSPTSHIVRNQGFEFSQCRHCTCDLIRSNRSWKTVPNGFRVVWRGNDRPLSEDPAQLLLNLPPVGRALTVSGADEPPLSRFGALLSMAVAGMFYLLWTATDNLKAGWVRLWTREPRTAVLKLPAR